MKVSKMVYPMRKDKKALAKIRRAHRVLIEQIVRDHEVTFSQLLVKMFNSDEWEGLS